MLLKKEKNIASARSRRRTPAKATREIIISIARGVFLIAFAYILMYPLFYMVSYALQSPADMRDPTVMWIPKSLYFKNFAIAFGTLDYWRTLKNTLLIEVVSALIEVAMCSVYAYGLARFEFRLKKLLMVFLVLIILLPDVMLILPRLMNFKHLDFFGILGLLKKLTGIDIRPNVVDTPFAFYLPSLFGVGLQGGLMMYIYIQFFKGLPRELEDAAAIDGAGPFKTFLKVIIPSSGVVILTVSVFSVVWHWNDYYLAMMYTSNNRPLAVIIHDFSNYIVRYMREITVHDPRAIGAAMAACLLFIAPPTIGYIIVQRKFIESIDRVGIVG